jgi:hypothetical protein
MCREPKGRDHDICETQWLPDLEYAMVSYSDRVRASTDDCSLTKDTTDIRRTSTSPRTAGSVVPSLQQTLMPNNTVYNPAPLADPVEMTGTGWADLDQLLGYSGNVDFPYFPGEATNLPPLAPNIDPGAAQWNDLFSNLTNANGWGTGDVAFPDMSFQAPQPIDWTNTIQQGNVQGYGNGNDQTQTENRGNEFYHHGSSLGN